MIDDLAGLYLIIRAALRTRTKRLVFFCEFGVRVNSVANAVSSLRKSGCVDKQRGYLAIIDTAKLRGIAENLIADE